MKDILNGQGKCFDGSPAVENACQTTKDGRSEMSWMMTVYGRATGQQGSMLEEMPVI